MKDGREFLPVGSVLELDSGARYRITGEPIGCGGGSVLYPVQKQWTENGVLRTDELEYVLKECYMYLEHYRGNLGQYRQEVRKIKNDRLLGYLRGAKCGPKTAFSQRVAFFLMKYQMFDVLWLIWKIRS